jgi:hypothetical protein
MMRGLVALALVSPGLAQNQCTLPDLKPPHGYFYEISGSNKQQCGTMKAGDVKCDRPFQCAKGFSGTATATCVPAAAGTAPLKFTGCTKNTCIKPTTPVTGYDTTGLACNSLTVKGIQGEEDTVKCETPATCAPGYALDNVQSVTAYCKTSGQTLTFSGCREISCKVNSGMNNVYSYDRMDNKSSLYPGGLATAAQIKNAKCNTIGTWVAPAGAVTDYKLSNTTVKVQCLKHKGDFVLSGCVKKSDCATPIVYTANMVRDTTLPCPKDKKLKHKEYCAVACAAGYHLKEKAFDPEGKRIKNYPQHPVCTDGHLSFQAECVEDSNFTILFVIIGVLVFGLILVPVVKYFIEVTAFNKKKSEGCTWNGKGELLNSSGEMVKDGVAESSLD